MAKFIINSFGLIVFILLVGCSGKVQNYESNQKEPTIGDWVILQISTDPQGFHPTNTTDAISQELQKYVYQTLLYQNLKDFQLYPYLAKSLPELSKNGLNITFELRNDAFWDNGQPITGKDVEFTFKVIKNPKVNCQKTRVYYEFLENIQLDPQNPYKVTFVANKPYFRSVYDISQIPIIPKYFYDPKGLMDKFSIKDLNEYEKKYNQDTSAKIPQEITSFAEEFNSVKYSREPQYIVGSGAYKLSSWETNQKIELVRKENWWADKVQVRTEALEAYPKKIIFKIIKDPTAVVAALKNQEIDAASGIVTKNFVQLKQDPEITNHYYAFNPATSIYSFIGINNQPKNYNRNPALAEKNVRLALAYITNVDLIIDKIAYGMAQRIIGPILKSNGNIYNDTLKFIPYDPEKAANLLKESGWKDSNNNGILDKTIDGKTVELSFEFLLDETNEERRNIVTMFKESAKSIGIEIKMVNMEFKKIIEQLNLHQFDLFYGAWSTPATLQDLKQLWHSESIHGGSNFIAYSNKEADKIIDQIRMELDDNKRVHLYKRFQEILHNDVPCIFLTQPLDRILIHKRFRNAEALTVRPGFQPIRFWTPKELVKYN
jgi:peptide/nickel transport system substrate-binding protein